MKIDTKNLLTTTKWGPRKMRSMEEGKSRRNGGTGVFFGAGTQKQAYAGEGVLQRNPLESRSLLLGVVAPTRIELVSKP